MQTTPSSMLNFLVISRCELPLAWMVRHNLPPNENKTEAIVISAVNSQKCAQPSVNAEIDVCGCTVTPKHCIRDIGVVFDSAMSMARHISRTCQMACCQLRSIARIIPSIYTIACKTVVHTLVISRLVYGNAVTHGVPYSNLQKLQMVQHSATRLLQHCSPFIGYLFVNVLNSSFCCWLIAMYTISPLCICRH